ncbi:hypothetical protein [Oryza sativa Japonica Group]|uniref:Uncharacterized protein n=1 Tax=Oryza sativa subsp. japonica TaxID=39947 RepID=Q5VPB7_ORYSJ|nr:hypothetical protein [Oryza sativa Japonica Group]BAD68709.1 hypothetical protein [Oryza sativa Japonica Group]
MSSSLSLPFFFLLSPLFLSLSVDMSRRQEGARVPAVVGGCRSGGGGGRWTVDGVPPATGAGAAPSTAPGLGRVGDGGEHGRRELKRLRRQRTSGEWATVGGGRWGARAAGAKEAAMDPMYIFISNAT